MADEQRPNNPSSRENYRRPVDDEWYRNFLRREFELIGINANTDTGRERTRSNFAFSDSMNNQTTREAISFLLDLYKEHEALEKAIELTKQRSDRGKDLRKGLFASIGEWSGRLLTGAIGAAVSWYFLSGKH